MPVQDYGLRPLGLGADRTMGHIANLQMEQQRTNAFDQRNALLDRRYTDEQTQGEAEVRKAQALTELRFLHPLIERGDAGAAQRAARLVSELSPEAGQALQADPANLDPKNFAPALGKLLGIAPPTPAPVSQRVGPFDVLMQGDTVKGYRGVPQPSAGGGGGKGPAAPQTVIGPDGEMTVDLGKASEGERVSSGYLGRMRSASSVMEGGDYAGYAPSLPSFMAFASLLDDETGVVGASIANKVLSGTDREFLGQALDFILAKMRKESGATIKGGEFRKEYINYFPMPNDSEKVLEQKKEKRRLAMRQLEISAGRAEGAAFKPEQTQQRTTPENRAVLPPVAALKALKEGEVTTFANGQKWTIRNNQYVQVQ